MGNRRSPYQLARLADAFSERESELETLSPQELSALRNSIKALGMDKRFIGFVTRHLTDAIAETRLEVALPTPTKHELRYYYSRLGEAAKELATLLAPLDREWLQIDRYWPEEPDYSGRAEYTSPLRESLIELEQAASVAARQSDEIHGHATHARRKPHEILAVAVAQARRDYFPHLSLSGSNNSPVASLYCTLCYIAGIDPPASPRHSLDSLGSCEKQPGYTRDPAEFPYHKTAPPELSEEELEFMELLFPPGEK
jgi:hypothetical protein